MCFASHYSPIGQGQESTPTWWMWGGGGRGIKTRSGWMAREIGGLMAGRRAFRQADSVPMCHTAKPKSCCVGSVCVCVCACACKCVCVRVCI